MTSEPRKASEVILKLEEKLDVALGLIRAQDLTIKILSNKLNSILEALEKKAADVPKFTVEAINNPRPPAPQMTSPFQVPLPVEQDKQIPISADFNLPVEGEPKGFRRTSRPETFAGDDAYLPQSTSAVNKMQQAQAFQPPPGRGPAGPPPGRSVVDAMVPPAPAKKAEAPKQQAPKQPKQQAPIVQNAIPVEQRVVNANGKSLYLADVEIIDLSSMQSIFKTRTNGMGKWMAALGVGGYRIIIRRMEPTTKERMEVTQDIEVDGTQSPLTLPSIIVKPS